MRLPISDFTTGETLFAAKQRADLLRRALLTLDDEELVVVLSRAQGVTVREAARIFTGTARTNEVLDLEKRAMAKLRAWFAAQGVAASSDIF